MNNLYNIKERTVEILENKKYKDILNNEHEIKKQVFDISISDETNLDENIKMLNIIEKYLNEKTKIPQEDMKFINEIAIQLKEQEIRKDDLVYTPLFKIITKDGENRYFITRKTASQYIIDNQGEFNDPQILEIISNKNLELEKLLNIIKKNF